MHIIYPEKLETVLKMRDGTEALVRPLKPDEDKDKLYEMYSTLSKETNYYRFLNYQPVTRWIVEQWCEVNYDDKMALVAIVKENGKEKIIADSRYYVDKTTEEAEIAIVVHDDYQGQGIGTELLEYTIEVARKMGVKRLYAYLSPTNRRIIHVVKKLGFAVKWVSDIGEYKADLPLQ
ncbi:MAG: GNAT family N-acetyltransferase [Candidatus Jordarchaeum sp.]|uniref:GNAT family N-acetyltransferase n=1 Tax=Candidatus Jordarchaeum sp. TaxID=2823881 RepID=UPI004049D20F